MERDEEGGGIRKYGRFHAEGPDKQDLVRESGIK
jgi:hypothetical protein